MADQILAGRKIAIVVENQYVPAEIKTYRDRFGQYGATVEFVSRLWGRPFLEFYSTVEPGVQDEIEYLKVDRDFDDVDLDSYAAVVVAANYVFMRLSWSDRDDITPQTAAAISREVPAARFFRRAMENPTIIKGAACHALGLLMASPETLAGRRVIYNKVMLGLLGNSGALYTPCPPGTPEDQQVIVDRDLVTNSNWHASAALVDRIAELIVARAPDSAFVPPGARPLAPDRVASAARDVAARMAAMSFVADTVPEIVVPTADVSAAMAEGRYDRALLMRDIRDKLGIEEIAAPAPSSEILIVAADHGVWASELALAMVALETAGYRVRVATLSGRAPMFLPASLDERFVDPTWGAGWVAPGEARLGWQIQKRLAALEAEGGILKLDGLIPPRPQAKDGPAARREYETALRAGLASLTDLRGVVVPGGTGAIIDLADNSQLEAILEMAHGAGYPILGVCYGVLALLYAEDGAMLKGASLTIHNRADDFVTGTGALTDTGVAKLRAYLAKDDHSGFLGDGSVWTTEWRSPTRKAEIEADAVCGPGAHVISPYTPDSCAVIDLAPVARGKGAIVTGRSIHCAYDGALMMIAQQLGTTPLDGPVLMATDGKPARRPGWQDYNAYHRL